ncbi:hypothetical protein [Ensifer adhaerens]|uniref:Uncharacterized protein n=1 Tax=Ensifer adhaerens TaxID=106592 RepID=A0A9Q9DB79_ENSAD|nr:hypothetical protein [Ensifer adhaerens]USJ24727.1 hypothetical protein NE863_07105 [Ensifer adhaerens]
MQVEKVDPIRIVFDGLDADRHQVELGALGVALQGASKLLGAGGQVALTGKFTKKEIANSVRVMALPPQPGSYEFWVYVLSVGTIASAPLLPYIDVAAKSAATKITEAVVNSTIAKWSGRRKEMDAANNIAIKALEEMGHTTRAAMQLVERVALANHGPVKQLVNPIGISAGTVQIGHAASGAFQITEADRAEIDRSEPIFVGTEQTLTVQITELDLVTKSCKVAVIGDEQKGKRLSGQITDPQVAVPNNPYSSAFDSQKPITVKCKPQFNDGELERIYISDVAS